MIATNVGWVEERRRGAASRRVTQHPNALYMLGFTPFNPTYASVAFFFKIGITCVDDPNSLELWEK
ncbi:MULTISPECIES: hypothetical protein [Calothrix]|uniref:Uncharacterized protein n=2 Tax=Calothrix TaxID=1186 RepID=A0ABR8A8T8_9CYAN|nr:MULTISPECIES: hypothetical protein [Calothrix]MBD2195855.1 hypothetical protein [Calothrix parietina FACHB-288]MBD2226396.1 hypothetical protein [Calothrix anomala FACHB-343]